MALTPQQEANWRYLVAAIQNEQGGYVNAKAKRYAEAILAVDAELEAAKGKPVYDGEGDNSVQWL